MTVTVGIDLAAAPSGTAIAAVSWQYNQAVVEPILTNVTDDVVLHWMHHPGGAVAIDCPFGWPVKFVELVALHSSRQLRVDPDLPSGWRREYVLRETDRHLHDTLGVSPLSVAADKIGHVAIRLAALLAQVSPHIDVRLDGSGALIEVYPAAALRVWNLTSRGYKGAANHATRGALVDQLLEAAPWLSLGSYEAVVRTSDHALDAVICALVARAKQRDWTEPPTNTALAEVVEGWIHIPTRPLAALL